MVTKKKRPPPPRDDAEMVERLAKAAPDILKAQAEEAWFDTVTDLLLYQAPDANNPHFYCRKCHEYHLKMHPHFFKKAAK